MGQQESHVIFQNSQVGVKDYRFSQNGYFFLAIGDDGNMCLYRTQEQFKDKNTQSYWQTNTSNNGYGPFHLNVQMDGNTCLYNGQGQCLWSTNTYEQGSQPYKMVVENDGNLVLRASNNQLVWQAQTAPYWQQPQPVQIRDTVYNEEVLPQETYLFSQNGEHYFVMQKDGNFVKYKAKHAFKHANGDKPIWCSRTVVGGSPFILKCQGDGNLCHYNSQGNCTWSSNTYGKGQGPYKLQIFNDGQLVMVDSQNQAIWVAKYD